jgi:hypothetical protein
MELNPIGKLRGLALISLAALALSLTASADSGSGAGSASTATAGTAATEEAAPCGCGGPKSYYLKKYGTIKPPAFQSPTEGQPQTTAPVNPPSTSTGG